MSGITFMVQHVFKTKHHLIALFLFAWHATIFESRENWAPGRIQVTRTVAITTSLSINVFGLACTKANHVNNEINYTKVEDRIQKLTIKTLFRYSILIKMPFAIFSVWQRTRPRSIMRWGRRILTIITAWVDKELKFWLFLYQSLTNFMVRFHFFGRFCHDFVWVDLRNTYLIGF